MNMALKSVQKTQTIILNEGPLDVMRLWQAGVYNAVGLLGTSLSEKQVEILWRSGVFNVVIAMDGDEPGQKAANKIKVRLEKAKFTTNMIELPEGRDVGDLNSDDVIDLFGNYMEDE